MITILSGEKLSLEDTRTLAATKEVIALGEGVHPPDCLPNLIYHKATLCQLANGEVVPLISSSDMGSAIKSPVTLRRKLRGQSVVENHDALTFGSAVHDFILLESEVKDLYRKESASSNDNWLLENPERRELSDDMWRCLLNVLERIKDTPALAYRWFKHCQPTVETAYIVKHERWPFAIKVKPDITGHALDHTAEGGPGIRVENGIDWCDIKTTVDITNFDWNAQKSLYLEKLGFYSIGLECFGMPISNAFFWVIQNAGGDYACPVPNIGESWFLAVTPEQLNYGRSIAEDVLDMIACWITTERWPDAERAILSLGDGHTSWKQNKMRDRLNNWRNLPNDVRWTCKETEKALGRTF